MWKTQKQKQKQKHKNKIGLPPNKRYCLTPLARHNAIDLSIFIFGMQLLNCTLINPKRFFVVINNNAPRQEVKKFTCGNWFPNNIDKAGVNTYHLKIFILFPGGFTLIFRNINKLGSLRRRKFWSGLNSGKSGTQVGNNVL